jgi:hypothetical protein
MLNWCMESMCFRKPSGLASRSPLPSCSRLIVTAVLVQPPYHSLPNYFRILQNDSNRYMATNVATPKAQVVEGGLAVMSRLRRRQSAQLSRRRPQYSGKVPRGLRHPRSTILSELIVPQFYLWHFIFPYS